MQQSKTTKGSISAAESYVKLDVDGQANIGIQITGTFSQTLQFEGTLDGTTWVALPFKSVTSGIESTSTTATGVFIGSVAGIRTFRIRSSAFSSGSASIVLLTSISGYFDTSRIGSITSTSNTPSIKTDTAALALNANRKGWMIQNVGTNPLFIRLGSDASASVFHAVIKGGSADNDGLGASISQMEGVIYTGVITIAGTSPKYVVTEL